MKKLINIIAKTKTVNIVFFFLQKCTIESIHAVTYIKQSSVSIGDFLTVFGPVIDISYELNLS